MGRSWLRTLAESDQVELVGLVDLDQGAARRAAAESGWPEVTVAGTAAELYERVAPQAVLNVTVPSAHAEVSISALRRGLPVLCEKPLAESVSTALSMVAAAELGQQLLMVSQSRHYWRHLTAFRRQIAKLGVLGHVDCTFSKAPHFGGFRDEMPYPLLVDMAIHQFDLARDLIGAEPEAVYCDSYNPAWSWYRGDAAVEVGFEFVGGARFGFHGSWCTPGLETSWNGSWRVGGEAGTAIWDGESDPVAGDGDGAEIPAQSDAVPEQIAGSLAEFVHALRTGATPWGEAHSNVLSLAMVEAAIMSAEQSRRVPISDVLEEGHAAAVAGEVDPDLREVLRSWDSVLGVVGRERPNGRGGGRSSERSG